MTRRHVAGKANEDTVPLSIDPIGIAKCLANGQGFETDGGRFTVNLEAVGAIQAKYTAVAFRRTATGLHVIDATSRF
jgi:hypothetical protein